MNQEKYVNAYKVIRKYESEKMPLDISYGLFKVKKILQDQWDFEVAKEQEIFDRYNPVIDDNGNFRFESAEDQTNFAKEISDLLSMEVDEDFDKVKINFDNKIEMSLSDIEALSDFVEF